MHGRSAIGQPARPWSVEGQPVGGWPSSRSTNRVGRAADGSGLCRLAVKPWAVRGPGPPEGGCLSLAQRPFLGRCMVGRAEVARVGRTPTHAGRDLAGGRRRQKARRGAGGPVCIRGAICARCTQARAPTADLQLEASGQVWGRPPGASLSRSPKRAATPRSARSLLWHTPMLRRPRWDFPAYRDGRRGAGRVGKRTGSDVPGARDDLARGRVVASHRGGRRAGGRAPLQGGGAQAARDRSRPREARGGRSAGLPNARRRRRS
jgi:hypothetical protein